MAQEIIVAVIVMMAALYVVWRFLPTPWRQRLRRVHPALADAPGCGGCNGCASSEGTGCGTGAEKEKATQTVTFSVSRRNA